MAQQEIETTLLELVGRKGYQPVKPARIAKQLKLDESGRRELKKIVKRLVKEGRLSYGANHAVCLPGRVESNRVTGVFRRMSGGYGFVRPAGAPAGSRDQDIYIPQKKSADAASGDVVLVQLGRARDGRGGRKGNSKQGAIVDVIERETHQFVGTYFERAGSGWVQVDGTIFQQAILVGDAGAKNARIDDKVVIEMVRFPSHIHEGEGVIVDVLGQRGDPGVDTLSIIHEFNLPRDFEEDVLAEARAEADVFDESIAGSRRDLTAETVITIDPFDARDFDDAISLEQLQGGHWRLGVHIADVSHFVKEKTPLDREAKDRATSVYLPDMVIPMLPEIISNNLASLQPNRVRYTKTAFIEFTADGARVDTEVCAAAIKSKHRFNYEEVDDFLAHPAKWKQKLKPEVHALVGRMHKLAMILRRRRFDHGSLEMSMPEVKVELDKDGRVSGAHLVEHTESHQIIEEFMLAANEAVAELLHKEKLFFLRRIHEAPDPRKIKALAEFVRELGFDVDGLESRFELQALLDQVLGRPEEHAVNYAVLRSMQKAVYSPAEEGHYALASDCYCHFTSPIRRYPDLTVHRLIDRLIHHKKPRQDFDEILTLGDHCSEREQRAEQAERELKKVKLLLYLSERIGEEMDGVVTGVQEFGIFVEGIQLPAEGLVHVTSLQDDYYHYDAATHSLSGNRSGNSYRLGDFVRVAVARVDVEKRELDYRLVGRLKSRPKAPPVKRRDISSRKQRKSTRPRKGSGSTKTRKKTTKGRGSSTTQKSPAKKKKTTRAKKTPRAKKKTAKTSPPRNKPTTRQKKRGRRK